MNKNITRILVIAAVIFTVTTLTSCRKGGINGDLDGQWRVLTVEDMTSGTVSEPYNLFYCLYLHTVNLSNPVIYETGIMTYSGTSLKLKFPYYHEGTLADWGIFAAETDFTVEKLNSDHLIIASSKSRITMRKF